MHTDEAKFTNHDLVVLIIILVQTHVADDVLVLLVLVKSDHRIRVLWIDLVADQLCRRCCRALIYLHLLLLLFLVVSWL